MPLRHEREIEEILTRAEALERPPSWWRRLRPPQLPSPGLPSASTLVGASALVLLFALLYGRFNRPAGIALALAGLALLVSGYAAFAAARRRGPGLRLWRQRPLDSTRRRWRGPGR